MGAREKDLNPDIYIGIKLPMEMGSDGTFQRTKTTLEQTQYNIMNLLKTIKGERLGEPEFGSTIHEILFEPMTTDIEGRIEESINEAISLWLPYVTIGEIKFKHSHEKDNQITVNIIFSLAFDPGTFGAVGIDFEKVGDILAGEASPISTGTL